MINNQNDSVRFEKLLSGLASFEQRIVIQSILQLVSKEYLSTIATSEDNPSWWKIDAEIISAIAGLISQVLGNQDLRKTQLITWLTDSSGAGVGESIAIRRASITSLAKSKKDIEVIFDKSLHQFGDQLYIKHTPIIQQEGSLKYPLSIASRC